MKTVIGLYDDRSTAEQVVTELVDAGFDRADISLVAGGATEETSTETAHVAEGATAGALTGASIGGLGGVLLGLGALAIPGIGPVVAAGPIVAGLTGAAIGAAAGGLVGALVNWGIPEEEAGYYAEGVRRGGTLVAVKAADDRANRAVEILRRYSPIDVKQRSAEWRASGWTGFDANAGPYISQKNGGPRNVNIRTGAAGSMSGASTSRSSTARETWDKTTAQGERVVPIVEEELKVGKREVETGGVRVQTHIEEKPVSEQVELREERVTVERRPVDRPVGADTIDAFKEKTIEMTERSEEAVAEKTARVVEEVVIGKEVDTRTETVSDTLRRTDVDVEQIGGFDRYNDRFRTHYTTNFANRGSGYTYERYQPAYQYGYTLANDPRYTGREWADIEMDARRDWETRGHGAWEEFKDAVRGAWNEVRAAVR
jgi:uncharacterized protein (TIGR02271 family)